MGLSALCREKKQINFRFFFGPTGDVSSAFTSAADAAHLGPLVAAVSVAGMCRASGTSGPCIHRRGADGRVVLAVPHYVRSQLWRIVGQTGPNLLNLVGS